MERFQTFEVKLINFFIEMPDTLVKLELICCEINCEKTVAIDSWRFLYERDKMNEESSDSNDKSSNVIQQYKSLYHKMTGNKKK